MPRPPILGNRHLSGRRMTEVLLHGNGLGVRLIKSRHECGAPARSMVGTKVSARSRAYSWSDCRLIRRFAVAVECADTKHARVLSCEGGIVESTLLPLAPGSEGATRVRAIASSRTHPLPRARRSSRPASRRRRRGG